MIDDILKFNAAFVAGEEYRKFETSKFPDKKIAIVTCMDTVSYTHLTLPTIGG